MMFTMFETVYFSVSQTGKLNLYIILYYLLNSSRYFFIIHDQFKEYLIVKCKKYLSIKT